MRATGRSRWDRDMQESVGDRAAVAIPRGRGRRAALAVGPGSMTLAVYGALAVGLALAIGAASWRVALVQAVVTALLGLGVLLLKLALK
jgi:hypothetical protein